jgi:hypothetical protein
MKAGHEPMAEMASLMDAPARNGTIISFLLETHESANESKGR